MGVVMKKLALFLLACLWGSVGVAMSAKSRGIGLGVGTLAIMGLVDYKRHKNIEPLKPVDEVKVKSRLQNLYDRGLLRPKPDNIALSYGSGFGVHGSIKPILYVEKDVIFDEFTALHEAKHINGIHTVSNALIVPVAFFIAFRKGLPPSFQCCLLRIGGAKIFSDSVEFFKTKYNERVADTHAAENCSDATTFRDSIVKYKDNEIGWINRWQQKYNVSEATAKKIAYLRDPHFPLTEYRADRLQRIYNRRVAEGSLVE
jgi:hypothetical protein